MSKPINRNILICPECGQNRFVFNESEKTFACPGCGRQYEFDGDRFFFVQKQEVSVSDPLDKIKHFFKKYEWFYDFLVRTISPTWFGKLRRRRSAFLKKHVIGKNIAALNLGSGNTNIAAEISNIDIFQYENTDLTCDVCSIPLKTNSVDVIVNEMILEHLPDPKSFVAEMYRILKDDGRIFCTVPFIYGFHASPNDFQRWTNEGLKKLFKDFEIEELSISAGPASGFLEIAQEFFAILFSFGNRHLHLILFLLATILTFPFKYLDILLQYHPAAKNIADGFIIIVHKKTSIETNE